MSEKRFELIRRASVPFVVDHQTDTEYGGMGIHHFVHHLNNTLYPDAVLKLRVMSGVESIDKLIQKETAPLEQRIAYLEFELMVWRRRVTSLENEYPTQWDIGMAECEICGDKMSVWGLVDDIGDPYHLCGVCLSSGTIANN